jgi:putative endonuclease
MCQDQTIYTGIAKDIFKRINQHKTKKGAKWTKEHGFLYYTFFKVETWGIAMKKEKDIKKLSHASKLEFFKEYGLKY